MYHKQINKWHDLIIDFLDAKTAVDEIAPHLLTSDYFQFENQALIADIRQGMETPSLMKRYGLSLCRARYCSSTRRLIDKLVSLSSDHEFDQSNSAYRALVFSTQFRKDVLAGTPPAELKRRYGVSDNSSFHNSRIVKQAQRERLALHNKLPLNEFPDIGPPPPLIPINDPHRFNNKRFVADVRAGKDHKFLMSKYGITTSCSLSSQSFRRKIDTLLSYPAGHHFDQSLRKFRALVFSSDFRDDVLRGVGCTQLARKHNNTCSNVSCSARIVRQAEIERAKGMVPAVALKKHQDAAAKQASWFLSTEAPSVHGVADDERRAKVSTLKACKRKRCEEEEEWWLSQPPVTRTVRKRLLDSKAC